MSEQPSLTIGELESKYYLYRRAMKMLVQEGRGASTIQRTLCWSRLETLHHCLPRRYKSPDHILNQVRREVEEEQASALLVAEG